MEVINTVISWLMKQRIHQIELFMKYPHEVQLEWFRKLIQTARTTEWGTRFDYASIQSPEDFRKRVPVSEYDRPQAMDRPSPERGKECPVAFGDQMVCQILRDHLR